MSGARPRRPARAGLLAAALVLAAAGCRERAEPAAAGSEPAPTPPAPGPAADSDAERKRACVATATAGADPSAHALIRALCAEWVELDIPGVALAIVEPGAPPFELALGVRCFGEADPVTPTTGFRIGSVSKPVTAAVALGLVADRALDLASEASLVPGFTSQAGLPTPTLADLLRHRSGLGEIDPAALVELDGAWLPALARSPAAGRPGEYHYSNAGYSVVGAMLEAVGGQPYATQVQARIAAPLGLAHLHADTRASELACGHLAEDRDTHPIRVADDLAFMPGDPRWMDPAGGLLSSAAELGRFALAIGSDALPGSAAMLEPGEPLPPGTQRHTDERYGLGLRSWMAQGGRRVYAHTGNNVSFFTSILFVPGERAIVVMLNRGVEPRATLAAAESMVVSHSQQP